MLSQMPGRSHLWLSGITFCVCVTRVVRMLYMVWRACQSTKDKSMCHGPSTTNWASNQVKFRFHIVNRLQNNGSACYLFNGF